MLLHFIWYIYVSYWFLQYVGDKTWIVLCGYITIWKIFHVLFQFRSYCFLSNPTIQKISRKYKKNTCTRVQKFKLTLDGFSCYNVTKYHSTSMRTNCNQYYWTWMHALLSRRGANKVTNIKKMPQTMVKYWIIKYLHRR